MKNILFILAVCLSSASNAQHFEWAASASKVDLQYQYACTDPRGNITVAGPAKQNWSPLFVV